MAGIRIYTNDLVNRICWWFACGQRKKERRGNFGFSYCKDRVVLDRDGKSIGGTGFVRRIRSSVLEIIGLRCWKTHRYSQRKNWKIVPFTRDKRHKWPQLHWERKRTTEFYWKAWNSDYTSEPTGTPRVLGSSLRGDLQGLASYTMCN